MYSSLIPHMSLRALLRYPGRLFARSSRPRQLAGSLILILFTPIVQAHEFWLVPHDGVTTTSEKVAFELRIGPTWPGVQTPRQADLIRWFKAQDALGTRDIPGREGSLVIGHLNAREPGATVVAMRTRGVSIDLPASEFNQYLQEEGLTNILDLRRKFGLMEAPSRESFSRCAKSIVFVDGQSQGFDHKMDLPLELIPRSDPLNLHTGSPLKLQLLFNDEPLPGTLVKAQLKADPVIELTAISDSQGYVNFTLPDSGLWLFNAVHMEPSAELETDWESLWASLTMELSLSSVQNSPSKDSVPQDNSTH
ncbi:DUF4198 domain-containing protein [Halomonas binhaiensis]|uniref:DUF4198 domain-containing protein n=1 Tax=Halomonas binhaiensis TaxID=2562282 RepID=A0A5C1NIA3_9GAMM|nr:DUF4198 domain-containing protein [Halomonas binhaiensis]QEM82158.1 DUF4198 domain-containing protein [Halomonas binhaiensis]